MMEQIGTAALRSTVLAFAVGLLSGSLRSQETPPPVRPQPPRPMRPVAQPVVAVEGQTPPNQVLQIFKLKHAQIDRGMQETLNILTGGGRFAFDERTNSLIVQTTEDKIPLIKDYLSGVDQPQPSIETKQIRLVWLIGGFPDAGKPPPKDLEKVIAELGKLGFDDLHLVAQTIIQTTPDGTFKVSSNPTLGKSIPCSLSLTGTLRTPEPQTNQLQVQVSVASQFRGLASRGAMPGMPVPQQPPESPQLQVQTDFSNSIIAPPGQPVILCASPAENATSVFIIQVMATEAR